MAGESVDLVARMSVVESAVDRLERTVNTLAGSMQRYVENQAQQPRPVPFKEIIGTAAASVAIFAAVLAFIDNRQSSHLEVYKYRIEQIEKIALQRPHAP